MSLDLRLLEELTALPGISGFEDRVGAYIIGRLRGYGLEAKADSIGNVVAHLPGPKPRLMLFAHMDEVGFVVRRIEDDGFVRIERVGGIAEQSLPGQRLDLWTQKGHLEAVAGSKPQHLGLGSEATTLDKVFLDVGARSGEQARLLGVRVGDCITYRACFSILSSDTLSAKSLDDRAGCALLLELAQEARDKRACDLYLAFTVQEEAVLRGAAPVAYAIEPDMAIGVDATVALDTPDTKGQGEMSLGQGPAIKVMDHLRGTLTGFISHQGLRRLVEDVARECGIPLQREVIMGLTTAASPLPFLHRGIPSTVLSFPCRYTHSAVEAVDRRDLEQLKRLLIYLVGEPIPWERYLAI
ncbi:MAG: M42 family metallopeptidase [Chloroflexi bacterium]|nr:M42 family metallopeptidase [Chloroflexota bacterium]